jgi:hypothetical protein
VRPYVQKSSHPLASPPASATPPDNLLPAISLPQCPHQRPQRSIVIRMSVQGELGAKGELALGLPRRGGCVHKLLGVVMVYRGFAFRKDQIGRGSGSKMSVEGKLLRWEVALVGASGVDSSRSKPRTPKPKKYMSHVRYWCVFRWPGE